uniref:2-cysteine adaptor domain protein n=1 Tax=Marseillevirus LCMAC101 TaxID=2506602 RepID=A0A481YSN1_9VIRU|nr:MAG: 2-cysteine adaptor domain protein [Marseillevirus LCMAC101]
MYIKTGPRGGKYYTKNGRKVYVKSSKRKSGKRKTKPRLKSGKRAGGSNVGKYKGVPKNLFCGPAGGAPAGSYPVNTRARAISAKSYARHSPNPAGIRRCVDRIARQKGWINPKTGRIKRSTKKGKGAKKK